MNRCGFVAIVGRPNVGKSTLMNALLGQKVAIATSKVQTTRQRIRGVLTLPERGQIVFVDTPGFTKPMDTLGKILTEEGQQALLDADAILFVVDGSTAPGPGDQWLTEAIRKTAKPVFLVINKIDQAKDSAKKAEHAQAYKALFEGYETFKSISVSAKTGKNLADLPKMLINKLPAGEAIYDEESVTDQNIRDIAQEMIREKAMQETEDEIPHAVAVFIDKYDEQDPLCTRIHATLFVDQKSQKGILIGKGGTKIKVIGQKARRDIEELIGNQVFLDLNVKVKENWRKDPQFLKELGLG